MRFIFEIAAYAIAGLLLAFGIWGQARGIVSQKGQWKGLLAKLSGFALLGIMLTFSSLAPGFGLLVSSFGFFVLLSAALLARPMALR